MPLGQKVKVCGRRFRYKDTVPWREVRHVVHTKYEGLKIYSLDGDRKDDQWEPREELWCGYYSVHSAFVFLCESCAVENGLKW